MPASVIYAPPRPFNADLTLVVLAGSLTMWMRFAGAIAAGWMADRMGRRAPLMISIQGAFAGAIYGINPGYANERFPPEVRAAAFCCHIGAIAGGLAPPALSGSPSSVTWVS
nr:hypothetical protein [uncultured Rhodopila sp.]